MNHDAPRKTLPRLDESLLTHLPPFSRLERKQIRTILDQASSRRYDAGAHVFDEGAAAERFFMLLDGYVRVVRVTATGNRSRPCIFRLANCWASPRRWDATPILRRR